MKKNKTYNYHNEILDYGFIENENINSDIRIEGIAEATKSSLIIVDTKGNVLLSLLKRIETYLNQDSRILVGLTNESTLSSLKKNGVNNGIFRSTDEKFNLTIIIQDKKKVYFAFDENKIFETSSKYVKEIFDYVNHIFWSKTTFERLQESLKQVDNARLSVILPTFKNDILAGDNNYYASEKLNNAVPCLVLPKEKDIKKDAIIIENDINVFGDDKKVLNINAFNENYYPILNFESLIKAMSFTNMKLEDLINKKIWYKNEIRTVSENAIIEKTIRVPMDKVSSYQPDFDSYAEDFNGLSLELKISIDILPMQLDNTFKISKNYEEIKRVEKQLEENLKKLENFSDEGVDKQVKNIRSESLLRNKIKMFNQMIGDKEFGVVSLNNKKNSFKSIVINEDDLKVPSEIIGKLYTKHNENYLATSYSQLENAKEWLKSNNIDAILVEANG